MQDMSHYNINRPSYETDDGRETFERESLKTAQGEDELASHLRDAEAPEETDHGPVPPNMNRDLSFYAMGDPFAEDWHAVSSGRFAR
jgi:hypothetical protein